MWNAPKTNLDAPTRKLQNIEHKVADQPAKKRATPCCIHVLTLLNRRGWKQLFEKSMYWQNFLCGVMECIM
jgi:hypothetical protein